MDVYSYLGLLRSKCCVSNGRNESSQHTHRKRTLHIHHRSDSQQPPLRSPCILGRAAVSVAAKAAEIPCSLHTSLQLEAETGLFRTAVLKVTTFYDDDDMSFERTYVGQHHEVTIPYLLMPPFLSPGKGIDESVVAMTNRVVTGTWEQVEANLSSFKATDDDLATLRTAAGGVSPSEVDAKVAQVVAPMVETATRFIEAMEAANAVGGQAPAMRVLAAKAAKEAQEAREAAERAAKVATASEKAAQRADKAVKLLEVMRSDDYTLQYVHE